MSIFVAAGFTGSEAQGAKLLLCVLDAVVEPVHGGVVYVHMPWRQLDLLTVSAKRKQRRRRRRLPIPLTARSRQLVPNYCKRQLVIQKLAASYGYIPGLGGPGGLRHREYSS